MGTRLGPLPRLWGRLEGGWGPGGWPRRLDKRGRRHRLAGGGFLLIRLDIVKAPHPSWVCVLGGGLRRPLLCLRFLSLIFNTCAIIRTAGLALRRNVASNRFLLRNWTCVKTAFPQIVNRPLEEYLHNTL